MSGISSHKTQGSLGFWPAATLGEYRVEAVAWLIVSGMVGKTDLAKSEREDAEGERSEHCVQECIKKQVRGLAERASGRYWG